VEAQAWLNDQVTKALFILEITCHFRCETPLLYSGADEIAEGKIRIEPGKVKTVVKAVFIAEVGKVQQGIEATHPTLPRVAVSFVQRHIGVCYSDRAIEEDI
jgi:hypothetical protein